MKIALISPKGPLYRHRGGIFKQSLRYSLPPIAWRLRVSPAPLGGSVAANLAYRYYARQLHRFYNCDWVVEASVRPAPAVS